MMRPPGMIVPAILFAMFLPRTASVSADTYEPGLYLILNWFRARGTISSGVVEGFNGKAKLTTRKAFGFRTPQGIEIALFHVLGRLPEPAFTHRFC